MGLFRRTLSLLTALAPAVCAQRGLVQPIQVQRKLALVIGNSDYPKAQLKNPVNDAVAMEATLKRLGFQVTLLRNADLRKMRSAIDDFASTLTPESLGFFYFAGHGLQVNRTNYLVPVDFSANRQEDVQYEAYPADRVKDILEGSGARLRILVLDACRNNPWKYSRGTLDGLAPMEAGAVGTLIAYATGDNNTAADNPADMNGLYTKFLMPALMTPGLNLHDVFQKAKEDVNLASQGRQNPTIYENIVGQYYLVGGPPVSAAPATVTPAARTSADVEIWNRIKDSQNPEDFDSFAKAYPNSDYAPGAQMIAAQLRRNAIAAARRVETATTRPAGAKPLSTKVNPKIGSTLLARMQQSMGGSDKLAAIKDSSQFLEMFMDPSAGGLNLKQTIRFVAPNHYRQDQELSFGKVIAYTDGTTGWLSSPMQGTMVMPPEILKQAQGELFRRLVGLVLSDHDSSRTVSAVDDHTVEIDASDGQSARLEMDPATGLPAKASYQAPGVSGAKVEVALIYSDWRDASGFKMPYKAETQQAGKKVSDITVTDYKFNTGLTEAEISKRP